jgi:hypothetical protein
MLISDNRLTYNPSEINTTFAAIGRNGGRIILDFVVRGQSQFS